MGRNPMDHPESSANQSKTSTGAYESNPYAERVFHNHHQQYQEDLPPAYTEQIPLYPQQQQQHQPYSTPFPNHHAQNPSHQRNKLIVIPATAPTLGSPFLRAYPPRLAARGLSRTDFLNLLDGLNRVAVKSPPLRALGLVGEVLQIVPLSAAQAAGFATNAAAQVGTYALSKGATEAYLRRANEETLAPLGLRMEVAKLDAVARVHGIPILDAEGKIARLLEPLVHAEEMSAAQRWLKALGPWVEELEVQALPGVDTEAVGLWGKVHTFASERERKQSEEKILKDRGKALEKAQKQLGKAEEKRAKDLAKLERKEGKVAARGERRKTDDKLRKIEQKREKAEMKHQDKVGEVEEEKWEKDKEMKAMRKVLWLVIRDVEGGSGFGGMK